MLVEVIIIDRDNPASSDNRAMLTAEVARALLRQGRVRLPSGAASLATARTHGTHVIRTQLGSIIPRRQER
jgi:hypothetical protein